MLMFLRLRMRQGFIQTWFCGRDWPLPAYGDRVEKRIALNRALHSGLPNNNHLFCTVEISACHADSEERLLAYITLWFQDDSQSSKPIYGTFAVWNARHSRHCCIAALLHTAVSP